MNVYRIEIIDWILYISTAKASKENIVSKVDILIYYILYCILIFKKYLLKSPVHQEHL